MQAGDFFTEVEEPGNPDSDPWGLGSSAPTLRRAFDVELVEAVRRGPVEGRKDIEVALGLAALVHDELQAYGTSGDQALDDGEIGTTILALSAVLRRLAVTFQLPFRNFTTFRSYWLKHDASHSWQARRDILDGFFEPLHLRLIRLEEQSLEALASPISPRAELGWPAVDEEIRELRRRFATASTPQDYKNIGNSCVGVLEALGGTVYDRERHRREGESVPPRDKTDLRIGRYIEDSLSGPQKEDLRAVAKKVTALAHHVKHTPTPTRTDAGIAADAVILLANMLRRLQEES
jgi:hypothetical protein